MANPNFNRWFFSVRGLRSQFAKWQARFPRPLLGGPLRSQVFGFYPGRTDEKQRAYNRVQSAFQAGLTLTEAPQGHALLIRSIPIYGTAGSLPGLPDRRFVYQSRSKISVTLADGTRSETWFTLTVQSDSTLTLDEIQDKILEKITRIMGTDGSPPLIAQAQESYIESTNIEWVVRRN